MSNASNDCPVEWVDAEDPLFMLYTRYSIDTYANNLLISKHVSGSTGKPKGVLHTVGGYMLYAATTFKYSFDYQPGDVYFCTADIGWITGMLDSKINFTQIKWNIRFHLFQFTGHSYVTYGPLLNGASSILV